MNERQHYEAMHALNQLCKAIVETVAETPTGASAGIIYAALLTVIPNLTSLQFNMLIAGLVEAGKLKRVGHLLFTGSKNSCGTC